MYPFSYYKWTTGEGEKDSSLYTFGICVLLCFPGNIHQVCRLKSSLVKLIVPLLACPFKSCCHQRDSSHQNLPPSRCINAKSSRYKGHHMLSLLNSSFSPKTAFITFFVELCLVFRFPKTVVRWERRNPSILLGCILWWYWVFTEFFGCRLCGLERADITRSAVKCLLYHDVECVKMCQCVPLCVTEFEYETSQWRFLPNA